MFKKSKNNIIFFTNRDKIRRKDNIFFQILLFFLKKFSLFSEKTPFLYDFLAIFLKITPTTAQFRLV